MLSLCAALLFLDTQELNVNQIRSAALTVNSDWQSDDFSDLAPFKKKIADSRIVVLGESSHGDGSTFEHKTRMIRFLHEEMGFNVLLFESDMVQGFLTDKALDEGVNPAEAATKGTFPVWSKSVEAVEAFKYISKTKKTKTPMTIGGFDIQPTTAETGAEYSRLIEAGVPKESLEEKDLKQLRLPMQQLLPLVVSEETRPDVHAWMERVKVVYAKNETESTQWLIGNQALSSLSSLIELIPVLAGGRITKISDQNPRDEGMGRNILFARKTLYPKEKIIIWAASFHMVREIESLDVERPDYSGMVTAGQHVYSSIKDEMYSIFFTSYSGTVGVAGRDPRDIPSADDGSLEAAASALEGDAWIFDLRSLKENHPLKGKFVARSLGHMSVPSVWSQNADAFFVQRKQKASTLIGN